MMNYQKYFLATFILVGLGLSGCQSVSNANSYDPNTYSNTPNTHAKDESIDSTTVSTETQVLVNDSVMNNYLETDIDTDGDGVVDRLDTCPNTSRHHMVNERGCTIPTVIIEEPNMTARAFFLENSSEIVSVQEDILEGFATATMQYDNAILDIEGYTDKYETNSDSDAAEALGLTRAERIKNYIITKYGVTPDRFEIVSYGFDRPVAPSDTEKNRAMNRRVLIRIGRTRQSN